MSSPTIMQIVPELDTGGAELSAIEISEAVVRAGGRAIIATAGGRLETAACQKGAEIFEFAAATKNPIRILANVKKLVEISHAKNVRLIHARSRAPAWSALWAAHQAKVPFVTTYHGAYNESGPLKRLYNSVMARGDIVIANSKYTADLIRQRYGTARDRLRVIYRGVDASFAPCKISSERVDTLHNAWGVSPGQRVIVQAARLTGWKGQRVLIAAVEYLAQQGDLGNVAFILAGDDQGRHAYRQELERLIAAKGLQDYVKLVGHVSDIAAAFAGAHASVIASTEPEAFGRTGVEAQALGCPVIATRLGAPQETVLATPQVDPERRTGWLVEAGDARALAAALREVLALSDGQRSAIGKFAICNVRSRFSLEQMQRQTLQVYDQLLNTDLVKAFDEQMKR